MVYIPLIIYVKISTKFSCRHFNINFVVRLIFKLIRVEYETKFNLEARPSLRLYFFSCSTQLSMKFQLLIITKMLKNINFSLLSNSDVFIMLINVRMPTIVGILTFMSMINVSSVELNMKKVLLPWGLVYQKSYLQDLLVRGL